MVFVNKSLRRAFNPIGNERLTSAVGLVVLVLALAELVSVVLGVHGFMSLHVFVGFALIPPVLLKLVSTGWRFVRYYSGARAYVEVGPPWLAMRLLAPVFVAATVVLFASGVAMGFLHGHSLSVARGLHGPASVVWIALLGIHALVYLKRAAISSAGDLMRSSRAAVAGVKVRASLVGVAVVSGLVIAVATVPAQHRWVDLRHGHHGEHDAGPSRAMGWERSRSLSHAGRLACASVCGLNLTVVRKQTAQPLELPVGGLSPPRALLGRPAGRRVLHAL